MISGAVGPGDNEHHTSSIWLVSILGGEPKRLRGEAYDAQLSPDDSHVVFVRDTDIWIAESDGTEPRQLLDGSGWSSYSNPSWSPDGTRVVYAHTELTEFATEKSIESLALDEDIPTVLVSDPELTMEFLMREDRLVYGLNEPAPRKPDDNLWEVAIDPATGTARGEPRRLTDWVGFNITELSTTASGKQLAFLNDRGQDDVFVGEVSAAGPVLAEPRRLTLDDRSDWPACWLPDSRSIVFRSDRYGTGDLLVQAIDARNATDLALGDGEQYGAEVTPDGSAILYWESEEINPLGPRRLLRIPVGGGPTEQVLESRGFLSHACASEPDGSCLLFEMRREPTSATLVVSELDPVAGRGDQLWDLRLDPSRATTTKLSPDGTRLAVVGHTEDYRTILVRDSTSGETLHDIVVQGMPGVEFTYLHWAPDAQGFYLSGDSPRGPALAYVGLDGVAVSLFEGRNGFFGDVAISPDGRQLAFGRTTPDRNVWMVEGF